MNDEYTAKFSDYIEQMKSFVENGDLSGVLRFSSAFLVFLATRLSSSVGVDDCKITLDKISNLLFSIDKLRLDLDFCDENE